MVPDGQGARRWMLGQVGLEPLFLRGASLAASDLAAVAVDRDDVPSAEIEAVVAARRVGGGTEVVEVVRSPGGPVVVVARDRVDPGLERAPGAVEQVGVVAGGAGAVRDVAQGQHARGVERLDDGRGLLVAARGAGAVPDDVTGRGDGGRRGECGCNRGDGRRPSRRRPRRRRGRRGSDRRGEGHHQRDAGCEHWQRVPHPNHLRWSVDGQCPRPASTYISTRFWLSWSGGQVADLWPCRKYSCCPTPSW